MGWSYTTKPRGQSVFQFFSDHWNREDKDGKGSFKVLDCAVKGRTAYMACETIIDGVRQVFAAVCLISYSKNVYNFGYKDMDESMGPYDCHCPASILEQLTPTTNQYAVEWREKCKKNLLYQNKRKISHKTFDKMLKAGDKIFLQKTSIPFVIFREKIGKCYHGSGYRVSSKFIDFEKTIEALSQKCPQELTMVENG